MWRLRLGLEEEESKGKTSREGFYTLRESVNEVTTAGCDSDGVDISTES